MHEFVIFTLAATTWYLGAAAEVTAPLWRRYPPWLDRWATCAACSGTWYTAGWALALRHLRGWSFFGLQDPLGIVLVALVGTWVVPILAAIHVKALRAIHGAPLEGP